jgi:hypothetical protein
MYTAGNSVIGILYRARMQIARRWITGIRFAAVSIVALAIFLLLENHLASGLIILLVSVGATWLASVWVMPWGLDSFVRKLSNIMRESHTSLERDSEQLREQLKAIAAEIKCLDPPQDKLNFQQRILTDIRKIENLLDDKSTAFADRAADLIEPSQKLRHIMTEFNKDSEEPYVTTMIEALDRYKDSLERGRKGNQASLHRLFDRANELRPPSLFAEQHKKYLHTLGEYVTAMDDYYVASWDGNAEVVRKAVAMVADIYSTLEIEGHGYITELQLSSRN